MTIVPNNNDLIRVACRMSFLHFVMKAFEILLPGQTANFIMNWHISAMCYRLQKVHASHTSRLILEVPPLHLKSIITSVAYTAWLLGQNPSTKILVASYGGELAEKHGRDTRILMNSKFYRELFSNTKIDVDRSGEIITSAGGGRKAISIGGAATGYGADYIIVDDITKASDANSEVEAQRAQEFYDMTLVPRLNDQRTGKIIVLQQRLSENDLVAYLRDKGNFDILSLPATAQRSEDIPIYGGIHHREVGDLLFPKRDSQQVLNQLRQEMGARAFSAQYDQNPTPPGGNRIRWEWFGTYDFEPVRNMFQRVVQSWDTGHSEEPTSSFSVCMTWGWRDGKWYLLDLMRGRWEYHGLKNIANSLIDRWMPDNILIEKASSGHSLFSDLRRRGDFGGTLRAIKPTAKAAVAVQPKLKPIDTHRLRETKSQSHGSNLYENPGSFLNGN